MRKLFFGLAFLGAMAFSNTSTFGQSLGGIGGAALGAFKCKVEVIPCTTSHYGQAYRQICHEHGNGLICICGQSTLC